MIATTTMRPLTPHLDHETSELQCRITASVQWFEAHRHLATLVVDPQCTQSSAHCSGELQQQHHESEWQLFPMCTGELPGCSWKDRYQGQRTRRFARRERHVLESQSAPRGQSLKASIDFLGLPRRGEPLNESIHRPKWRRMWMRCRQ